jgi:hypothetical protein
VKLLVNSEQRVCEAVQALHDQWEQHRCVLVTIEAKRTLDQSALSFVWYEQIARELKEDNPLGVRCECKLRLGVPILRAEDPQYRAAYDAAIKPLTYQQKLMAMEFWPTTSLMDFNQFQRYLLDMQAEYGKRGVRLEFPENAQRTGQKGG